MWEECPIRSDKNSRENKLCSLLLRKKCTSQTVSCASEITPPMRTGSMYLIISRLGEWETKTEGKSDWQRERRNCTLCIFFHLQCNFQQWQLQLTHSCMGSSCTAAMREVSDCTGPHLDDSVAASRDTGWLSEKACWLWGSKYYTALYPSSL